MTRLTGTCVPDHERTLTSPLRIDTSVASTSTPGLVTISRLPLRTSASISMCECGTVTWVKSSTTLPLPTRTSSCRGTSHCPSRFRLALATSMRATARCGRATGTSGSTLATPGRSAVSAASSP